MFWLILDAAGASGGVYRITTAVVLVAWWIALERRAAGRRELAAAIAAFEAWKRQAIEAAEKR